MSSRVLTFHYVLTNSSGEVIDTSRKGEPFHVMEGGKQIIPALEEELFKMQKGGKKKVQLEAARAYGNHDEKLKMRVSRAKLPAGNIQIGTQYRGGPHPDAPLFTVAKIEGDDVFLDGNHPLAGVDLTFEVEVMEIREATTEELSHGHAHGAHGHHSHS